LEFFGFTPFAEVEHSFNMRKLKKTLTLCACLLLPAQSLLFAQKAAAKEVAPPSAPANLPPRGENPQLDATAFGFGAGTYGQFGILGGHLQIGVADWLRLHGGITGSLPGDQPSGNFSTSNYAFMWMFTGGLMFTGGYYKNIARPYSMLDLTYQYDARAKAGGLNGGVRFGVDLYMTQDWAVYIEAGVNLAMMREALAPYNVGGVVGVGVRTFF
jgi:hypothetical protein